MFSHIFQLGGPNSSNPMLQVVSAISGEDIAVLKAEELEGKSAEVLKGHLAHILGVSRFRQRLLREDHSELKDEDLPLSRKVQLVVLQLLPPCPDHEEKWIAACMSDDE